MEFKEYLKILAHHDGSDLYLTVEARPVGKFDGALKPLENIKLTKERTRDIAYSLMDEDQQKAFEQLPEMNLAISEPGVGRFRVNIFKQRNCFALVIRNIKLKIPNADTLPCRQFLNKPLWRSGG